MRCLALAEAWIAGGGEAMLASASIPAPLAARATRCGVDLRAIDDAPGSPQDAAHTRAAAVGATALVIDGYVFNSDYLDRIAGAAPTLVVDDAARLPRYRARWILNQNAHAGPHAYDSRNGGAALLLGGKYALLRGEFADLGEAKAARQGLFATFGGVDPFGASFVFLKACARLAGRIQTSLAIGAANPRAEEIARAAEAAGIDGIVDVRDMARRLSSAALVVSAGGATLWEGCASRAPMLVVSVAPEEAMSATALAATGGCRYLGPLDGLDPARWAEEMCALWADAAAREDLGAQARKICDGGGARRVAEILASETPR